VRVFRRGIRHLVFGDRTRFRVELADQRSSVSSVPNIAVLILNQAMWAGVRCLEGIFLELPGLRVEPAEHIGHLSRVPNGAVLGCERVMRA
jgi:hypothetical protein